MKIKLQKPPRTFVPFPGIELTDMGEVILERDEQVTFRTPSGRGNDVVRKDWGFFLSNSINANLRDQGFKTAMCASSSKPPRLYLMLVEEDRQPDFFAYLKRFDSKLVCWLDEWFDSTQRP